MSATSGATFVTDDLDLLRLVHAFAHPRTIEEVVGELGASAPEQTAASIDNLIRGGVLTPASQPEVATTHHWDWSALAFHRRSRQHGFQKMPATATSAVRPRRSPRAIPLVRGSGETGRDLGDVLDARRSWRRWPAAVIGLETFSRFLWLSARAREIQDEDTSNQTVSRPYPSAGAAYSLEIYPVIAPGAVESIDAGIFRYLSDCHCLEPVSEESADYLPFLDAAGRSAGTTTPPIVLIITSRFARQSESYRNLAYSLVLKEVGCLFQTLYLVAECLGLAPCALGGGTPARRLARLCHTNELAEPVVGEFMLGPR
jgi:oxazoline/thiazoline dehydrogenase